MSDLVGNPKDWFSHVAVNMRTVHSVSLQENIQVAHITSTMLTSIIPFTSNLKTGPYDFSSYDVMNWLAHNTGNSK